MSRIRQVPVMDLNQRDRIIHQTAQQHATACRPRPRKNTTRFRWSDTPSLLSNGCSSVRELCNNVQSITVDLNNLISSIESILPLLSTYLAAIQSRSLPGEPTNLQPPIDVPVSAPQPEQPQHTPSSQPMSPRPAAAPTTTQQSSLGPSATQTSTITPPMPRPEDIQQLLENPLVKNLLQNFMNGAQKT